MPVPTPWLGGLGPPFLLCRGRTTTVVTPLRCRVAYGRCVYSVYEDCVNAWLVVLVWIVGVRSVAQHTGEKPFQCRHCDYAAARKGQVTVHERTHTGERPYACKLCPMRFRVSSALLVHNRVHTGERPYKYVAASS